MKVKINNGLVQMLMLVVVLIFSIYAPNSHSVPVQRLLDVQNTLAINNLVHEDFFSDVRGLYIQKNLAIRSPIFKSQVINNPQLTYLTSNQNPALEPVINNTLYKTVQNKPALLGAIVTILLLNFAIVASLNFLLYRFKFFYLLGYIGCAVLACLVSAGFQNPNLGDQTYTVFSLLSLACMCLYLAHISCEQQLLKAYKQKLHPTLISISCVAIIYNLLGYINSHYVMAVCFAVITGLLVHLFYKWWQLKKIHGGLSLLLWGGIFTQALAWSLTLIMLTPQFLANDVFAIFNSIILVGIILVKDRSRVVKYNESLTHDEDTGLPNKQLLLRRLATQVKLKQAHSLVLFRPAALLNSRANFGYGHANEQIKVFMQKLADQLAVNNALGIESKLNVRHFIARFDDGIFAFIIPGLLELSQIEQFVCVTNGVFAEGVNHNNTQLVDRVDFGVANYPLHAKTGSELIQRGLQALSVKPLHGERWHMYSAESSTISRHKRAIASALREAIDEDQLSLYFQPQINLKTGEIHGAEALLRWEHPVLGHISPDQFIPISESTGLISELTEWVVAEALKCQRLLIELYPEHIMSVNISAKDLLNKDLPVLFITLMNEYQLDPENIMLELTESATLDEGMNIKTALNDYRLIGLKIAIDDFGTGYSSLAYLSKMGFDEIKIDKQFVMNIEYSKNDQTICRATCDIARSLDSYVVAEGIEDKASLNKLQEYGCHVGQGYYFSRPMAFTQYLAWLSKSRSVSKDVETVVAPIEKNNC